VTDVADHTATTPRPSGVTRPLTLGPAELQRLLPHSWPFLLLDRVTSLEPGVRAVGVKCVTNTEWPFAGHFPGRPIFPGVLLIEAAAQLCGIVAGTAATDGDSAPRIGYLASVKQFRLRVPVEPGDQVHIEAVHERTHGALSQFRITERANGRTCANGVVMIGLG